jgi:hypothetical protein
VIPRLQGKTSHAKWNAEGPLSMTYESLVEFPLRFQITGSDADRDLLYSLHGFQLKTNVTVTARPFPKSKRMRISFTTFQAQARDRYDWDYSEHLTVPNPDFGSKDAGAVAPASQTIKVYHSNAKRVEDAKLAAPYDVQSRSWNVSTLSVKGDAEINPTRSLGW